MTPYLLLSAVIHGAVLAAFLWLGPAFKPARKYYVIDFMGGQSGQGPGKMEPAPAPSGGKAEAAPPAPQVETPETAAPDDPRKVSVKKEAAATKKREDQRKKKKAEKTGTPKAPRDKGMKGGRGESAEGKGDIQGNASGPVGGAGTSLEIGGFGPGGSVQAGPRFPYQWYVQTIYKRLWETWDRADAGDKECGVAFTIARDGGVSAVKVDESSGDGLFDINARRAVENSAPFPPLPEGFTEPQLRVFVKFRLQ